MLAGLSGNVLALGFVSLFNDVSSEMVYPLLPAFLAGTLGGGALWLGAMEGAAESAAAFLKLASGVWADRARDRTRLVLGGYGLSCLTRPLLAAAGSPAGVLLVRLADRAGKGLRTPARDALLAESAPAAAHGLAFGFQRGMDSAGAVLGPLLAAALIAHGQVTRTVFGLAGAPALLAVAVLALWVRETKAHAPAPAADRLGELPADPRLRRYLAAVALFTLGNSSDALLLLQAGRLGVPAAQIPLLWAAFNLVRSLAAPPLGALSDRLGRRPVLGAGWLWYALCYAGFAAATQAWQAWALFLLYGLHYGLSEGPERALLAELAPAGQRGRAFGWMHGIIGVMVLPAGLLGGWLWQAYGPAYAFGADAALAGAATLLLLLV